MGTFRVNRRDVAGAVGPARVVGPGPDPVTPALRQLSGALGRTAKGFTKAAEEQEFRQDSMAASKSIGGLAQAATNLGQGMDQLDDESLDEFIANPAESYSEIADKLMEDLSPQAQTIFERRLSELAPAAIVGLSNRAKTIRKSRDISNFRENAEGFARAASADPTFGNVEQVIENIDIDLAALVGRGVMTREQAVPERARLVDLAARSALINGLQTDPTGTAERLRSGDIASHLATPESAAQFTNAGKQIVANQLAAGVDKLSRGMADIDQRVKEEQQGEQRHPFSPAAQPIFGAGSSPPFVPEESAIFQEEMDKRTFMMAILNSDTGRWAMSDNQRDIATGKLKQQVESIGMQEASWKIGADRIRSGIAISPTDPIAVAQINMADRLDANLDSIMTSGDRAAIKDLVFARAVVGKFSDSMSNHLRRLSNGTAQDKANLALAMGTSMELLGRGNINMAKVGKMFTETFTDEVLDRQMLIFGMGADVQAVNSIQDLDKPTQIQLTARFKELKLGGENLRVALRKKIDGWFDFFVPTASEPMLIEFEQRVLSAWVNQGGRDIESAVNSASVKLLAKWSLDRGERWTVRGVEAEYGTYAWEELDNDLSVALPGRGLTHEDVITIPLQESREGRPAYAVLDKITFSPLTGDNGDVIIFQPSERQEDSPEGRRAAANITDKARMVTLFNNVSALDDRGPTVSGHTERGLSTPGLSMQSPPTVERDFIGSIIWDDARSDQIGSGTAVFRKHADRYLNARNDMASMREDEVAHRTVDADKFRRTKAIVDYYEKIGMRGLLSEKELNASPRP